MFGNLCSTFGPDNLHVHLKSPDEVTPLSIDVWVDKLRYCSDPRADWVIDGLKNGFKVGHTGGNLISASQNMPWALSNSEVVDNYILKELKRGSIAEPFSCQPIPDLHFNRFGLIPKQSPNDWRMIIDLSYPEGKSVNDFIPDGEASVIYSSIDDAISMIIRSGKSALMAKFDIKSAYIIIPIHFEAWHLFGMRWRDNIFIDLCLAFGLRSACRIFTDFADILEWIIKFCAFIWFLIHYLDDFFHVCPFQFNYVSRLP